MLKHSFNRFFFQLFPIPKFFAMRSFGLDISDESIKYVELIDTRKGMKMGKYGEKIIPKGILESGKIKDAEKMENILGTLRKEIGIKSVHLSLPEEQVYLFKLKMEKEGLKNIREGIELILEEHIPISAEDAIFDYELFNEDEQSLEMEVATIPKNIIENYLSIFQNSKIKVESCELEAQAISRAVIKKGDLNTYMIVDFGKQRTGVFIVSRGVVMLTSTLNMGGVMLNEMIAKSFKINIDEAEKMKIKFGLQRNTENKEIFAVLLNSVSILRDEIVKRYLYWHTHPDENGKANPPIKNIILCGGDSNLIGLKEYLSISMKSKVEMADPWINIRSDGNYVPDINFKQSLSFSAALGLALGDYEGK
ncbi:MAG: pilus assembly protein PilM [Patescibacteria group bacterium]